MSGLKIFVRVELFSERRSRNFCHHVYVVATPFGALWAVKQNLGEGLCHFVKLCGEQDR